MAPGASLARGFALALLVACGVASGQPPESVRELYLARSGERDRALAELARKEGSVTLYSTLTVSDARAIAEAFEKKYGVKVTIWRAGSEKILQRAVTEARAGRFEADAFEMNAPQLEMLYREKLLEEFWSPAFADIPPAAFPKHRHYVADRFAFYVLAYNTNLVKPSEAPSSYAELLDPRWRGKIGIEAGDVAWFAAVARAMGEADGIAYFRRLAAQKPDLRTGHILIAELVAAGEIPLTPTAYNNNIETLRKKGAPVEWKPLAPAFGRASAIGLARHPAHAHAALLFADFLLSREGQEILRNANRVPASLAVPSRLNRFPYELIDPSIVLDEWDKWSNLWSGIFLGGQPVKSGD